MAAISYRRDVDGLRALAVIPIILFHLGTQGFSGGFVGVDIFFVISGYLIGGIIISELDQQKFSFADFWVRRIRRIIPALTLCLLVTSFASLFILLPSDLENYARSLIASALFSANIYFYSTAGYFEQSAIDRPLLHLWSLGIEEQFYLFFPFLAWGLHRWKGRIVPGIIWLGIVLSLLLSIYFVSHYPNAAFYLLPTRAWELLLGVGIALLRTDAVVPRQAVREVLASLGFAAMMISIFGYQPTTPFPGLAAIPPCLGAALVIVAGISGTSWISRLLQSAPLVWTGKISFSLYLWHWPLIVFAHYYLPTAKLSLAWQGALFFATYLFAFLSWYWVETPLRKTRFSNSATASWAPATIAVVCAIAGLFLVNKGFASRFSSAAVHAAAFLDYSPKQPFREGSCFLRPGQSVETLISAGCVTPKANEPNVLLLGNSHAAHLWAGLSRAAPDVNVMQATASGWNCVPVLDSPTSPTCDALWHHVFTKVLEKETIDLIIISATWEQAKLKPLARTLSALRARGVPVILIGPGAQYKAPLPRLIAFAIERNESTLPAKSEEDSPRRFDGELRRITAANGAEFLSAYDALCSKGCPTIVNGTPLMFDADHFTVAGSELLARRIISSGNWRRMLRASAGMPHGST